MIYEKQFPIRNIEIQTKKVDSPSQDGLVLSQSPEPSTKGIGGIALGTVSTAQTIVIVVGQYEGVQAEQTVTTNG